MTNLINHFTLFLYQTICRSLFDEHKQLFALLLAIRIAQFDGRINLKELKFLMVHPANPQQIQNPCPDWLGQKNFEQLCDLDKLSSAFSGIVDSLSQPTASQIWKRLFESDKPELEKFPLQFEEKLTSFQRFLPLVCFRPDRVLAYARIYIQEELGKEFTEPSVFNIGQSYKDSNNLQPILFLLNDMADPISDLMSFAEQQRMSKRTQVLSLGRGVERPAINLIQQYAEKGGWCVLQNCHLCVKFLKMLEQTLEQINSDPTVVNKDFRLWLTSQPTSAFPVTILQNSVKISVDDGNNLKANLLRVWQNNISEEQLNDSIKVDANKLKYKKLVYSLSLFYAVLLQRKKYGSIGFNTPYAWSASDIQICIQQLPTFLDKYLDTYPKQALLYLFAEINIGGCVTDAIDQRTVNAIVEDYLNIDVVKDNYMFQSGRLRTEADANNPEFYQLPGDLSYDAYLEQINELIPQECHPVNIGLNMNSNITADRGECQKLLDGLMDMYTGKLQQTETSSEKGDESGKEEKPKESGDLQLVLDL